MRKGCSTLERTDAFLDLMPLSAESAQSRPFMVEGFLATVQRIEEMWGSEAASGRFATPVQPESAWQDASSSLTRACAMDTSDTFAVVVSTACKRPLPASTPICALYPKCQFLPFLDWCASGSRAWPLLFAEAAASSAEPYPGDTGRLLIHAHMALGEPASQAIGPSSLRELADALEREADAMEREMDVDGTEGILI